MNRTAVALLLLTFAVAGLALTARAQQDPSSQEEAEPQPEPSVSACPPDRLLVKIRPGADSAVVIARHGGTVVQTIPGIDVQVVTVPGGKGQQTIDALNADPEVQYAEPDQIVRALDAGSGC
jgi:thermitase